VTGSFELLEHTADIGIRATGDTLEEAFAAAAEGLASILGAWFPGEGESRVVRVEGRDPEALLVAWLDEVLYLREAEDAVFGGFEVRSIGDELEAVVRLAPAAGREIEGQGVKAATYHRLEVRRDPGGAETVVYLDV